MQLTAIIRTISCRCELTRQTTRVMKLTAFILLSACLTAGATGFSQITLSEKNVPLSSVFKKIQQQSGYEFLYPSDVITKAGNVSIELKNATLDEAVRASLTGTQLTYTIRDKTVVIKEEAIKVTDQQKLPPAPIDIHGRLLNETGDPVTGATVQVKATGQATATDEDGKFVLKGVDENATLIFTGADIETQEVRLKGRKEVLVSAKIKIISVQDVVINQGYYTRKQRFNTGNVTRVDGKDIQKQPVTDPMMALEGRVPGLQISQTSGLPGANMTIKLRGTNFLKTDGSPLNLNDPLYIVDGVPFNSSSLTSGAIGGGVLGAPGNGDGQGLSPFNVLSTSDIESIEVLKDADATAIYGARGANGVILITTKKGKAGKMKCGVNLYTGTGRVTRKMDLLNTPQFLGMAIEALSNANFLQYLPLIPGELPAVSGIWDTTRYTDWQKVLIDHPATMNNAEVSLSGGNDNTQYLIGGGYSSQGTLVPGSYKDQKASAHFSLSNFSANKRFQSQLSIDYVNDNNNLPGDNLASYITLAPDSPPLYDSYGNLNWAVYQGSATWQNPMAYTLRHARAAVDNLNSSLNLIYEILPGLHVQSSFGYNHSQMNQSILTPASSFAPPNNNKPNNRKNSSATTDLKTWNIEPTISYAKKLASGLLEILVGTTFQETKSSSIAQAVRGFSSDALISNPNAGSNLTFRSSSLSEYRFNSLYGRIGYNWKDKYLVNLTGRRDGSSRFGSNRQFGNFSAVGMGWIFSEEKFIANAFKFLSFGKIRASYGSVGSDGIGDYQFLSTYSIVDGSPSYQGLVSISPTLIANPYLQWQVLKKAEAGIDLGFLKDRINLSVSYYRHRTGNQLVGYPLPYTAGFTSVQYNLPAVVQNSGTEIVLNTVNFSSKYFHWRTDINLTIPRDKLVSYPGIENSSFKNRYTVGKSLSTQYVYHYTGVDPQTGMYTFANKSGNGSFSDPNDYILSKPITQDYFGGIANSFSYRGIQLDIFFEFVKQLGYSYQKYLSYPSYEIGNNQPTAVLNHWEKPGDISSVQEYGPDNGSGTYALSQAYSYFQQSDGVITDASFVRLKTLALSYQFPGSWIRKVGFQTVKAYMQAQNLWTITKYYGLDPETGGLNLPPVRMITFGIQLGL